MGRTPFFGFIRNKTLASERKERALLRTALEASEAHREALEAFIVGLERELKRSHSQEDYWKARFDHVYGLVDWEKV